MEKDELLKQSIVVVNKVNSLRNGIELCDEVIGMLGEQPRIIIDGNYGQVVLDDPAIGLNQKAMSCIASLISNKISVRQREMGKTLNAVLKAIDEVFSEEPEPSSAIPKAYGAVSVDNIDF